jgi:hypothetical protein
LWGDVGKDKTTEKDFTQDYDCIRKSLSPYPKISSPESLNSTDEVRDSGNSPKNNELNLQCTSESCSPVPGPVFLVSMYRVSEDDKSCVCNLDQTSITCLLKVLNLVWGWG